MRAGLDANKMSRKTLITFVKPPQNIKNYANRKCKNSILDEITIIPPSELYSSCVEI